MTHLRSTWIRNKDGWKRGPWLVREAGNSVPEAPSWELCRRGADGNLRALDKGMTARGMMDQADISDGV